MEETFMLLALTVVMLIGSFLAGSIPLFFSFSEDKLKKITVLGAGLLVGTALVVIIPEGVRSLAIEGYHHHDEQQASPTAKVHDESKEKDPFSVIGISLVLGFVFMLLVDQISENRNENLSPSERNITATIGLVVHAAADGIALGAAATTSHTDVEIIVFLAIMLHKAPAAFGLVTFLMHEGIERQRIRKHLLIFSAAAPLLTLLTYFCIGKEQKETLTSMNGTGIAMLFSAGTFLYVATVHVLAELTQNIHHSYSRLPTLETTVVKPAKKGLGYVELITLVIGCVLPMVLSFGHHH
ncbi:solute carrier family 39 zinc transporter member 9-related [Holotrichia oblita]|uniref:Solute carrier family 39 zinc transporter member 9-related n=1 Tax=Holotrichia oblita TaxID=644536 RepID=A0ACB9SHZ0_HOLOL|nr:solute carrier family 39 zinc transporter member 9-related [Holotrichia oblita]